MPYILNKHRCSFDDDIKSIANNVRDISNELRPGVINYIFSKMLKEIYGECESYRFHNEVIGILESAKMEWYRRYTSKYEELCIDRNGDI